MKRFVWIIGLIFCITCTIQAKDRVIERPPFLAWSSNSIEVDKIVMSDTVTTVYIKAFYHPKYWIKIATGSFLKDNNGNTVFNKFGNPVIINQRPPTVTGLALALGFSTRLSLLNYQGKKEFMNTITRAKARVEAYAEERLFDRDGTSGAQFSLRNNFKGWTEKTELDEEEQQARIEQIRANTARMSGGDGDEDGGVEIVNDAPKEASEDIGDNNPEIPADI